MSPLVDFKRWLFYVLKLIVKDIDVEYFVLAFLHYLVGCVIGRLQCWTTQGETLMHINSFL